VIVAREILKALNLDKGGIEIISCPTCSRVSVDLISKVRDFEKRSRSYKTLKRIKVAVMGCEVNGPGEARHADIGIAFSKEKGYIFEKGEMTEKVTPERSINRLTEIIESRYLEPKKE